MDSARLAALPATQQNIWHPMPAWVTAAFAVAVWVGLTGAVALLLRRRLARPAFAVSLIAAVVQFGVAFLASPEGKTIGTSEAAFPAAVVLIGAALLWFAGHAARRGWLA
jgi:hypothetical protein